VILAPLRGVTIRCFRETFADVLREVGFDEAITPFVPAIAGFDAMKDRELKAGETSRLRITPQFIGKDPDALRICLRRIRSAGYETADLNCGCPFPMIRNKGRGSGLLRTPDVLRRMLDVGCAEMGEGRFSIKTRLGVDRPDELLALMPLLNVYPLRFLALHARTARQMYDGPCNRAAAEAVAAAARMPVVHNGDLTLESADAMVGRAFVRHLGERGDCGSLMRRYVSASAAELSGDRPVLGRMKELMSYWKELPRWSRLWQVAKLARTTDELVSLLPHDTD